MYPLVIKHGWLENPLKNGGVHRKITDKWFIFHCHVLLPEGSYVQLQFLGAKSQLQKPCIGASGDANSGSAWSALADAQGMLAGYQYQKWGLRLSKIGGVASLIMWHAVFKGFYGCFLAMKHDDFGCVAGIASPSDAGWTPSHLVLQARLPGMDHVHEISWDIMRLHSSQSLDTRKEAG